MATKLQIFNWALQRIGEVGMESELEDSAIGDLLRNTYDLNRKSMLRSYPWNFCQTTKQLTEVDEDIPDYRYAYALPADCLFPTKLIGSNGDVVAEWDYNLSQYMGNVDEWEIRTGHKLYSNIPGLIIKYTIDVDDESLFDELFADAFAWRLANEVAMPITKKPEVVQNTAQGFLRTMAMARGMNGAASQTDLKIGRDWVHASRRTRGNPRRV